LKVTSELGIESARTSVGRYALGIFLAMAWASTCGRGKGEWSARFMANSNSTICDGFCSLGSLRGQCEAS